MLLLTLPRYKISVLFFLNASKTTTKRRTPKYGSLMLSSSFLQRRISNCTTGWRQFWISTAATKKYNFIRDRYVLFSLFRIEKASKIQCSSPPEQQNKLWLGFKFLGWFCAECEKKWSKIVQKNRIQPKFWGLTQVYPLRTQKNPVLFPFRKGRKVNPPII